MNYEQLSREQVSYFKAYIAWLFCGWMGAHRFYLGKWLSGGLYMFSFGIFLFGWALDFFLIPSLVKSRRQALIDKWEAQQAWSQKMAESSQEGDTSPTALVPEKFELATWANKSDILSYFEFPIRLLFFLIAPLLFTCLALSQGYWELILLMMVILIATSFIHMVQRLIHFHPEVEKIPILSDALSTFKKLHSYYMENKPRSFIFYAGYFVFGFLSMPFSSKTRKEFSLYKNMILGIFILLIVETALDYKSVYPPYLTITEAIGVLLAELFFLFFMIISFMMPMITTSFSLSLSGKNGMLRILTFLALALMILSCVFIYQTDYLDEVTSIGDDMNFKARMNNKDFRNDITVTSEMFLAYYGKKSTIKQTVATNVHLEKEMTELYRRNIEGFVAGNETALTSVFAIEQPGKHTWYGIRYKGNVLFITNHHGEVYKKWGNLPEDVRGIFEKKIIILSGENEYKQVYQKALIEDLY